MKFTQDIKKFFRNITQKRSAVYELAKRDFQAQNKNTYLGIIWGYIQPLTYIFLLVFVFSIGLRVNPGGKVPFVVYLISGMIAWQFFGGTISALTGVVKSHSFLVKRGDFSLSILHVARIMSALIPHLALIVAAIIIAWIHGISPGIHSLQIVYYIIAMCFLLMGLGWITSATSIFVNDVFNIVTIIIQFGFWFTPIIWNLDRVPEKFHWIIKLNPMCYIVNGYRDSIIYKIPFWAKPMDTLYFWIFTAFTLAIGVMVFRRLKPHFGEVI